MCGIFSYFSNTTHYNKNINDLLKNLTKIGSVRGEHSTGLMIDDGVGYLPTIVKKGIPGYDFARLPEVSKALYDYDQCRYLVGHNRYATVGAHSDENSHPFAFGNITGVHNGSIFNGDELSPGRLAVDSQHIFKALSEKDSSKVIPEIEGAFNLLWNDAGEDTMHIARNSERPYALAYVGSVNAKKPQYIIGASEIDMLRWLVSRHDLKIIKEFTPKTGKEYIFDAKNFMDEPNVIEHQLRPVTNWYGGYGSGYNSGSNWKSGRNRQGVRNKMPSKSSAGYAVKMSIDFTLTAFKASQTTFDSKTKVSVTKGDFTGYDLTDRKVYIQNVKSTDYDLGSQWYTGSTFWKDSNLNQYCISPTSIKKIEEDEVINSAVSKEIVPYKNKQEKEEKKRTESYINSRSRGVYDSGEMKVCSSCNEEVEPAFTVYEDGEPMCVECLVLFK